MKSGLWKIIHQFINLLIDLCHMVPTICDTLSLGDKFCFKKIHHKLGIRKTACNLAAKTKLGRFPLDSFIKRGARVAQWVRSLDLTTHTSLSPIRRGFAPGFVNYKKGCTRLAAASDNVTSYLPMVGGSLRVLWLPPPLKLVAMI